MPTPRHQDDPNRPRAAGDPDYDARRDGTTHTGSVSDRTLEHERATTSTNTAHRDPAMDRAAHPAGTARTDETVRTTTDRGHDRDHRAHRSTTATGEHTKRSAAQKGLWVGVLTFLALALIDWLSGPSLSTFEALTFFDTVVYAIVGIVVGVIVKQIDLRRHSHDTKAAHHRA